MSELEVAQKAYANCGVCGKPYVVGEGCTACAEKFIAAIRQFIEPSPPVIQLRDPRMPIAEGLSEMMKNAISERPEAEMTQRIMFLARMETIRAAASYVTSIGFMLIASWLIMYAPDGRTVAADIVAGALLFLAAGISGFTRFFAKFPGGIEMHAGDVGKPS